MIAVSNASVCRFRTLQRVSTHVPVQLPPVGIRLRTIPPLGPFVPSGAAKPICIGVQHGFQHRSHSAAEHVTSLDQLALASALFPGWSVPSPLLSDLSQARCSPRQTCYFSAAQRNRLACPATPRGCISPKTMCNQSVLAVSRALQTVYLPLNRAC